MPANRKESTGPREPFERWVRGGSTHWGDCWKDHLICALVRAVDMLDQAVSELVDAEAYDYEDNEPREQFIEYIRENR